MEDVENGLHIPVLSCDRLQMRDSRRLTGPGLLWSRPGAVVDIVFDGFEPDQLAGLWQARARRVLDAVGWHGEKSIVRLHDGGANLALSAPMDQLYAATAMAEAAWHFCASKLLGVQPADFAAVIAGLKLEMAREANPPLVALINAAQARGLDTLCDDEAVSLGHGAGSQTWPAAALPAPQQVDWTRLRNLPIGLITGTNGKTTTTRLAMAMARAAGAAAGLTSTDMVQLGDEVLERGDFSGPGGARLLLRDGRLEMGFLELARGGILRRGLPVRQAMAAVVTNVASDHLGEYGINTVAELAAVKFAIRRGLRDGGVLILNADDAPVVAEAARLGVAACWFSCSRNTAQIVAARAARRLCGFVENGAIWLQIGPFAQKVIAVADVPIAMGGAAQYNVSNALAAVCLCHVLGVDVAAMRRALAAFRSDPVDNPGRCNEFAYNGARVFVDFAHNPHSIAAVTGALAAVPAKRKFIMLSHAGDRSDRDISALTNGAFAFNPDFVVAAELANHLRGRELGEVTRLIRQACIDRGMADHHVIAVASPSAGVAKILERLMPGDLALLLVHSERDLIFGMLKGDGSQPDPVEA